MHAVQCVAKGELSERIPSILQLGTGADESRYCIASVLSLLTQQPRALQKHARLLVTMQKGIVGQRPAVGTRCTMLNTLNTQTSHKQQLKQQICSLWSSILMSKSLPVAGRFR